MAFELAQVIAQLVQAIAPLREAEGSQDGLMDLLGRPASDLRAAVQEDFHQPDDARLVDLDAGIAHRADGNRQGNALQQRKVPVNVEPLGLVRGEAAGNGLELLPDRIEILQALLETEVPEVVGAELIAQERCELLVLLQERVLEVGAIDMVAVLDLLDDGGELAGDLAMQALPEDLGDLVGCQPPQPQLTASLKTSPTLEAAVSSGGEQIDDFLNCRIGTMVGGLEATAWSMSSIGLVMEAAVGEGPAQPFVKEEEQESNFHAFCREAVGVVGPISLQ